MCAVAGRAGACARRHMGVVGACVAHCPERFCNAQRPTSGTPSCPGQLQQHVNDWRRLYRHSQRMGRPPATPAPPSLPQACCNLCDVVDVLQSDCPHFPVPGISRAFLQPRAPHQEPRRWRSLQRVAGSVLRGGEEGAGRSTRGSTASDSDEHAHPRSLVPPGPLHATTPGLLAARLPPSLPQGLFTTPPGTFHCPRDSSLPQGLFTTPPGTLHSPGAPRGRPRCVSRPPPRHPYSPSQVSP